MQERVERGEGEERGGRREGEKPKRQRRESGKEWRERKARKKCSLLDCWCSLQLTSCATSVTRGLSRFSQEGIWPLVTMKMCLTQGA